MGMELEALRLARRERLVQEARISALIRRWNVQRICSMAGIRNKVNALRQMEMERMLEKPRNKTMMWMTGGMYYLNWDKGPGMRKWSYRRGFTKEMRAKLDTIIYVDGIDIGKNQLAIPRPKVCLQ